MRKSETFTALNGLRFLAALAVVIFHYATRVNSYGQLPSVIRNVVNEGPAAVGFFFILSGFVLGHRNLRSGSRPQAASEFHWARFVRLYPAYLVAFVLFLPIAVQRYVLNSSPEFTGHHTFVLSAVLSSVMLQSWTPLAQAWNGPSWSLSVEAFMYLMFPLIGFRLARLSHRKTAAVLLLSWLVPSSFAFAYVEHWIPDRTWHLYITNNPLLWMPLFVMGICASRMVSAWGTVPRKRADVVSTAAFALFIPISLLWPHRWSDVFVTGGMAPLLAAVIVFFTRPPAWITKSIGGTLFNRLGEASYVVYILQAPLWFYWQVPTNYLRRAPLQTNVVALWQFVGFVAFLVFTSLAVQRFIEAPLRNWMGHWKKTRGRLIQRPADGVERQASQPSPIDLLPTIN
jgi:peptidoglycan/LPS O-acetylase OafA/YrhL